MDSSNRLDNILSQSIKASYEWNTFPRTEDIDQRRLEIESSPFKSSLFATFTAINNPDLTPLPTPLATPNPHNPYTVHRESKQKYTSRNLTRARSSSGISLPFPISLSLSLSLSSNLLDLWPSTSSNLHPPSLPPPMRARSIA